MKDKKLTLYRARICTRLRSPGIDSKESIPPAYLAGRAGTSYRVVVPARQTGNRFLGSLKGLQIRSGLNSLPLPFNIYMDDFYNIVNQQKKEQINTCYDLRL